MADIDLMTMCPSIATLEAALTANTAGVVLVHMGGVVTPDIAEIAAWSADRRFWLVEDCAHAHGSWLDGKHAGGFGAAGAFSFFASKVITSGEGGMLVTDDDDVADRARLFRNLGKPDLWVNHHVAIGTNGRMHRAIACCLQRNEFLVVLDITDHRHAAVRR